MSMKSSSETLLASLTANCGNLYVYLVALLLVAAFLIGWRLGSVTSDPREPPIFPCKVPMVGHLLGIIQHQAEYFQMLR